MAFSDVCLKLCNMIGLVVNGKTPFVYNRIEVLKS